MKSPRDTSILPCDRLTLLGCDRIREALLPADQPIATSDRGPDCSGIQALHSCSHLHVPSDTRVAVWDPADGKVGKFMPHSVTPSTDSLIHLPSESSLKIFRSDSDLALDSSGPSTPSLLQVRVFEQPLKHIQACLSRLCMCRSLHSRDIVVIRAPSVHRFCDDAM
jgi:hypothetical protein